MGAEEKRGCRRSRVVRRRNRDRRKRDGKKWRKDGTR